VWAAVSVNYAARLTIANTGTLTAASSASNVSEWDLGGARGQLAWMWPNRSQLGHLRFWFSFVRSVEMRYLLLG
jgi:hypothetical protein